MVGAGGWVGEVVGGNRDRGNRFGFDQPPFPVFFGSVPKLLGVGEPQEVNFLCCVEPSFWVLLYP